MDYAEIFTQVFDLEFPFGPSIEVKLKLELAIFVGNVAISRLRALSTFPANLKFTVFCFLEQRLRDFDQFIMPMLRIS